MKLNTDGSSKHYTDQANTDGLLRDNRGCWFTGFAANLGTCDSMTTEIQEVVVGLEMAWKEGYRRVILEMDSLVLVNLIKNQRQHRRYCSMLSRISKPLDGEWEGHVQAHSS